MNDTAMIFALALASNRHPEQNFKRAFQQISQLGAVEFSPTYLIPCRDGVGADYWNAACLVNSHLSVAEMSAKLKQMERDSGRIRPSHQIALDIDVIAWGMALDQMQFNGKKLPLALDVKIPLYALWKSEQFKTDVHYPMIVNTIAMD